MFLRPLVPPEHQCTCDPTLLDDDPTLLNLLCRIHVASQTLLLGTESRVTSMILFHRYIAKYTHRFVQYIDPERVKTPRDIQQVIVNDALHRKHLGTVASACIFLACKTENQPRRIRDVVNVAHMLDFQGQGHHHYHCRSDMITVSIVEATSPPLLDEQYWEAKQVLVSTEQALLRFISFDVQVSHPHRILAILLDHLFFVNHSKDRIQQSRIINVKKSRQDLHPAILQKAWRIINDALFYPPCLRLPTLHMVCASIQLAIHEYTRETQDGTSGRTEVDKDGDTTLLDTSTILEHETWRQCCSKDDLDMAIQVVQQAMCCQK